VNDVRECVTFRLGDQWFGLPVTRVQEVLPAQRLAPVPLAPDEIAGLLNLRGHIVTVLDVRARLGLPVVARDTMNVVINDGDELVSLLVDEVGDVDFVPAELIEPLPVVNRPWDAVCVGVVQRDGALLVLLDPGAILGDAPPGTQVVS